MRFRGADTESSKLCGTQKGKQCERSSSKPCLAELVGPHAAVPERRRCGGPLPAPEPGAELRTALPALGASQLAATWGLLSPLNETLN